MKKLYHFLVTSYKLRVARFKRFTSHLTPHTSHRSPQTAYLLPHTSYLIPLFAFCIFSAEAQNSFPNDEYHPLVQEGKVWSVVFVMGDIQNYQFSNSKLLLQGDTIIDEMYYKKMYVSTKEYPEFPHDWTLQNFMREDENKRVWCKDKNPNSVEKLYYDFSLEIGDTVPESIGFQPELVKPVIVEDITYQMMNNGEERKIFHLSIVCYGFPNHNEFWIEGIGSSLGVLSPITGELIGGFDRLLCCHENEILIFNDNPWWGKCYIESLDINLFDNHQINIYPNPAKDIIYIEDIENLDINTISIVNIQGQTIKQYETKINQIDVSNIHAGLYFIIISTSKGNIIQKLIINQ